MTFKATQVYVVMREVNTECSKDTYNHHCGMDHVDAHPVAIFTDLETAEGNAEGYNLQMKDDGITGLNFYVTTTILYE